MRNQHKKANLKFDSVLFLHVYCSRQHKLAMSAFVDFNGDNLTPEALKLVLSKAQEWGCSPAEAVAKLLDQLGRRFVKSAA